MKSKKKKSQVPLQILAARLGSRLAEREIRGDGFHSHTQVVRSRKLYTRKRKHKNSPQE